MWTLIGQSGVMNNIVETTAVFAPVVWGLLGASVLPVVVIMGMALREYWAQTPTQQQEPVVVEMKLAA